MTYHKNDKD